MNHCITNRLTIALTGYSQRNTVYTPSTVNQVSNVKVNITSKQEDRVSNNLSFKQDNRQKYDPCLSFILSEVKLSSNSDMANK